MPKQIIPMTSSRLFVICSLAFASLAKVASEHVNVGVMFPIATMDFTPRRDGAIAIDLMMMAVDEINNKTDGTADNLLPEIELRTAVRTALGSLARGSQAALDLLKVNNGESIAACIGPFSLGGIKGRNC